MTKTEKELRRKLATAEGALRRERQANARQHSRRCCCPTCWGARERCGHADCLMAAIDAGDGRPVVCKHR